MDDVLNLVEQWQLDLSQVREQMYRAGTPRERERWHSLWLLAQGWSAAQVAVAPERDPHTIGDWLAHFRQAGPTGLTFEQTGGSPVLTADQQAQLKAVVQGSPQEVGLDLANWNWKVVREFVQQRFGRWLSRSPPEAGLNYLHRLGFVLKRPKKRLLKAKEAEREDFVAYYAELRQAAQARGPRYSLTTRPISEPTPSYVASGYSKASQRWWTLPVPGGVRRPATTRRSAWNLVRWK